MNILFIVIIGIGMVVWYIRPLYNFFAKRKYVMLSLDKPSLLKRIETALPALLFYTVIMAAMFYPALTNDLIDKFESGSLIIIELVVIFFITRLDKRQTKYKVDATSLTYFNKEVKWTEDFTVTFRQNIFIVLHKPRFIIETSDTKIIVPVLSSQINDFIKHCSESNKEKGYLIEAIYENIKNYYVTNIKLAKHLKK